MRSVTRSLTAALIAAAVMLAQPAFNRGTVSGQGAPAPGSAAKTDRARFVGTYELVTTETKDPASGKWTRTPNFNSNGYIIFADTGHMAVQIMPKVRPRLSFSRMRDAMISTSACAIWTDTPGFSRPTKS